MLVAGLIKASIGLLFDRVAFDGFCESVPIRSKGTVTEKVGCRFRKVEIFSIRGRLVGRGSACE